LAYRNGTMPTALQSLENVQSCNTYLKKIFSKWAGVTSQVHKKEFRASIWFSNRRIILLLMKDVKRQACTGKMLKFSWSTTIWLTKLD
jgi:hypothetical protein